MQSTQSNKTFIQKLKDKGLSDEEMARLSYHMFLLANEKLKQQVMPLLDKADIEEMRNLKTAEETAKFLKSKFKEKTGNDIEKLLEEIYSEIEETILGLGDDLEKLFQDKK